MKLTTDRIDAPYSEVAEEGFEEARQQQDNSHRYVQLLTEFQNLSATLESQRFRFSKLKKFKNRQEVRDSVARLNTTFGDEISVKIADATSCCSRSRETALRLNGGVRVISVSDKLETGERYIEVEGLSHAIVDVELDRGGGPAAACKALEDSGGPGVHARGLEVGDRCCHSPRA